VNNLINQLSINIISGCESQVDWQFVEPHRQFPNIIAPRHGVKAVCANNVTGRQIARDQVGGTAVAAIGRLGDVVTELGRDPSGLG
jgi:hypothetical protein